MKRLVCAVLLMCACGSGDGGESSGGMAGAAGGGAGKSGAQAGQTAGMNPTPGPAHFFPSGNPWTRDVSGAAKDPQSANIIAWLDAQGFGLGRFQIDFGIELLRADANTPRRAFTPTKDFFTPDCDNVPVPLPAGGNIEGNNGYACASDPDGDCHLLVWDEPGQKLFEMWRAHVTEGAFRGGCLAVWDLTKVYPATGRGDQCSSADAAGFPIAPLLFNADEVAAGEVAHAIRFILPNERIRQGQYVRPATHGTRATTGPMQAPPYGVRLRLRSDYPLDMLPTAGARTVAKALQKYGMLLADGGNVALTAQSDRHTKAKWEGLLGSRDLQAIRPKDFDVIDMGTPVPLTLDCER
ncbi:MAG: hypothetical protein SF187_28785 [Deltaproteobacteria bacterium]|nr:hypothetical protein [Deltaproteobacteria bacterium]